MAQRVCSETRMQVNLLHERGDLSGARINFVVELPRTHLATQRKLGPSRLGLQLTADDDHDGLTVQKVPENGNWDTPVVQHNQEQKLRRQPLYTVQPGDWLTAVNEKDTSQEMLREIQKSTWPMTTTEMNITVGRELQDLMEPYKAPPGVSSPAKPPKRTGRERHNTRHGMRAPMSHCGRSNSTGDLRGASWRRYSASCQAGNLCRGSPTREPKEAMCRAVPSGNLSSLAWQKAISSSKEGWGRCTA